MKLITFGALAVTGDGDATRDPPIQRRQLAVLALLAAAGPSGATRDQLLALLWPDQEVDRARHALEQSLYGVRRAIGAEAVVAGPTSLVLDPLQLPSDVGEFVRARERGDLEAAVAAYGGPFLDGVYIADAPDFHRWVEGRRKYFADEFVTAVMRLAASASAAGEFLLAVGYLRRAAASDPLSGTVAHALMTALAAAGDRAAALDAGRVYSSLVREELDAVADTAVRRLMDQLRVGSVRSSPAATHSLATTPESAAPRPSVTRLNALLGDRYHIVRELGSGGMATVYLARDLKHDRDVALKVLRPEVGALLGAERFLNEIRISARLDHPHILTLIDSGAIEELIYFVLPYVSGESLRARLDREHQLPIDEALSIAEQVASALDYAHRLGVIHRDIKPENILLRERDAVLTDFGIAVAVRQAGGHRMTETGFSLGTPQYMSPEQATGARDLDGRSDIYSLAAVLYELLTGEAPHTAPNVQSVVAKLLTERPTRVRVLRPAVSEHVEAAVMRGLEKVRADRFATAGAFGAALSAADVAPRPERAFHGFRPLRMKHMWRAVAAIAVIGGATALVSSLGTKPRAVVPKYGQLTFTGNVTEDALSPDGTWFAYVAGGDSGGKLMVQEVVGGPAREVASGRVCCLSWSPDGAGILYTNGGSLDVARQTFFVPLLGGSPRLLTNYGGESRFSPDGTQLAQWFLEEKKIRLTRVTTGDTTSITLAGPFTYLQQVEWSPSGKWLAFLTQAGGPPHTTIWAVNVDGSAQHRVVASDTSMILRFQWSPAGDAIYYQVGLTSLWHAPYDAGAGQPAGRPRLVLDGLDMWRGFTISRDGKALLYTRNASSSNLWLLTVAGSGRSAVLSTKALTTGTAMKEYQRISPNGRRIAFMLRGSIFAMPLEGGPQDQLTFSDVSAWDLDWSPDGATLAFLSYDRHGGTVKTVPATGGPLHVFAATAVSAGGGLAWSPGSNILYAQPGNRNYTILDPVSGKERSLVPNDEEEEPASMGRPYYSPDGKRIALDWYRKSKGKAGTWLLSLADSSLVLLREGARPIGWSPAGDAVYGRADRDENEILAIPVKGGEARHLFRLPFQKEVWTIAVAPDGRHFVCEVVERQVDVRLVQNFDPAVP